MTGRQFSFFLGPSDQIAFEEVIRASGDVAFLKWWPKQPRPEIVESSVVTSRGGEILSLLIARKSDLGGIDFAPVRGRDVFSCDVSTQTVVEFSRCFATDKFIRAGRLYWMDAYDGDDGKLKKKSADFIEWADHLLADAKKSLVRVEQGCFAGADALRLRHRGLAFEGLDVPMGATSG